MTNEFAPKCLVGLYLTHGKSGEKASHGCYNVVSILKCFIVWVKIYIIQHEDAYVSLCVTTEYILRSCRVTVVINDITEAEENI